MFPAVAAVSLEDVIDQFLRSKTMLYGQAKMAYFIGTKRQGVNGIMNRKEGRRFNMGHLSNFAARSGAPMSQILAELATLAWQRESELLGPATSSQPPALRLLPSSKEESSEKAASEQLAELLARVLEELNRRR